MEEGEAQAPAAALREPPAEGRRNEGAEIVGDRRSEGEAVGRRSPPLRLQTISDNLDPPCNLQSIDAKSEGRADHTQSSLPSIPLHMRSLFLFSAHRFSSALPVFGFRHHDTTAVLPCHPSTCFSYPRFRGSASPPVDLQSTAWYLAFQLFELDDAFKLNRLERPSDMYQSMDRVATRSNTPHPHTLHTHLSTFVMGTER